MPGQVLTVKSQIQCTHGGKAILTTSNAKLMVDNTPALLESDVHAVAGCAFTIPGPKPSPCVRITWSAGTTKAESGGKKVLMQSSVGKCYNGEGAEQGVAIVVSAQTKTSAL